jgi:glyoxylase-like metal-dependent hydrolase (beta-lactamase superfamily II)
MLAVMPSLMAAGQNPPAKPAPQAPPPLTVQEITKSLYLVKGGSGANTAFYVTEKEVFAVDAKMSAAAATEMLAAIRKATSLPLTTVIITHSDGDHINGLPGFPKGLHIISHEKCRADIAAAAETQPELKDYIPDKAYAQPRLELHAGGKTIVLAYFGPAHTSGDTAVIFPQEKAAFLGDLVFVGRDPVIHRFKGGRSDGCIRTLQALLAVRPPIETFLSGHADPVGRAEIETAIASIEGLRVRIKGLIDEGKTLAEIKTAFGIEDRPAPPGGRRYIGAVETIYLEFTEK